MEPGAIEDTGIDRRGGGGAPICFQEFILTTAGKANLLSALEGSGACSHGKF